MLDNTKSEHKQSTSRLKRMLHSKSNVAPLGQQRQNTKDHRQKGVQISSPILHHSTSIYSLASPTRTSFEVQSMAAAVSCYEDLYQQGPSSFCVTNTVPPSKPRGRRSHSVHHTSHPTLFNSYGARSHLPPMPAPPLPPLVSTVATTSKDDHWRRHSCSSTAHCASQEPPSAAAIAVAQAITSPSCPSLTTKASLAANAASSVSLSSVSSPPPSTITLEKSRSTPLRPHSKIKTYNVSSGKKRLQRHGSDTTLPSASQLERDLEKKKRQQELEDLISGRRGSTLKLSLTPKNTLLN
ncbi:hypothetical protein BC941DRAFT_419682 [Chlamydoabsidia padenii]|nr:hypothetical protein BC941DRAFT_419682 [Chlamydoabsidia padenii]